MQVLQEKKVVTKLHAQSSYELITLWIDKGYKLGLSANALQLMTVLLRFYNPKKKYVFPHQQTLSEHTNTSIASVKRGLNELLQANLIIKRRTQSGNIYAFTGALFELLNGSKRAIGIAQNEPCMIQEQNKISRINHHHEKSVKPDDDILKKSKKHITLEEVPEHIRNNKNIKNACGYWYSLTAEEKKIQLDKAKEIEQRKIVVLKFRKKIEEEKAKEIEHNKKCAIPLEQQYTKETAEEFIKDLAKISKKSATIGISKVLAEMFEIDVAQLLRE